MSLQSDTVQRLRDMIILEPEIVALSGLGWDGAIKGCTPIHSPKGGGILLGIEASGFGSFSTATVGGRREGKIDTSIQVVLSARVSLQERPDAAADPDADYIAAKNKAFTAQEALLAAILRYAPDPNPGDSVLGTGSQYPARPAGNDSRMWNRVVPVEMDTPAFKDSLLARLFVNVEFQIER